MSFNLRDGTAPDGANAWAHRQDLVADTVRRSRPDMVGTQEGHDWQLRTILERVHGYDFVGVGRDDGRHQGEHAAILYRTDEWSVLQEATFWLSPTPEIPGSRGWGAGLPRICTWARLAHAATRREVYVFNVHLDHQSQPAREHSAEMLADRIARRQPPAPVIVLGDFNAELDNPAMQRLLAGPPSLRHAYGSAYPDGPRLGTMHGFTGRTDGRMIDHILVSSEIEVLSAEVVVVEAGQRCPSDHFPVVADLRG